jgi:hypothetical protein
MHTYILNLCNLTNCTSENNVYLALKYKRFYISGVFSMLYVFLFCLKDLKIPVLVQALCCLLYLWAIVSPSFKIVRNVVITAINILY